MFKVELPNIKKDEYNILDFNAIEGGLVSNTNQINNAIKKANIDGGGTVIIPKGLWLTGPITLLSNVNLYLERGSYLLFDKNKEEYPLIVTEYEGIKRVRCTSPINSKNQENIKISGYGTIDGNGHLWRPLKEVKVTKKEWERRLKISNYVNKGKEGGIWFPTRSSYEASHKDELNKFDLESLKKEQDYYDFYRPVLLSLVNCNKILIEGVTICNSPAWNIHPLFCNNVTIRNCYIKNPFYAQNGDGLDLESCTNCHIYNNTFEVGDDGICIKSGKNKEARIIKKPSENIYIHDCKVLHAHGGFVIGSEMSRGVRNVIVKDCIFEGTDIGIRFKTQMGRGGVVENIEIDNIRMLNIINEAIIFTGEYFLTTIEKKELVENEIKESLDDIPEFKNIKMNNIICHSAKIALRIKGLKEKPIHDITLSNSYFNCEDDIDIKNSNNIILKNTIINQIKYLNEDISK